MGAKFDPETSHFNFTSKNMGKVQTVENSKCDIPPSEFCKIVQKFCLKHQDDRIGLQGEKVKCKNTSFKT